ncbi:hypothetical protein CFREI_06430 [Corynebacterium freiburgense]|nr:hypothetical protein CFREI_06430 [Corynebacterium freiburgense]
MRSRYTAFVLFDAAYLHRTHAPETRPSHYELDRNIRFFALEIHEALDNYVEFSAHYLQDRMPGTPTPHILRERSKFRKEGNRWFYVDGIFKN